VNGDIELHDSWVAGITLHGGEALVALRPAYVHRDGSGWTQDIALMIHRASVTGAVAILPVDISEGTLHVGDHAFPNLVPIASAPDITVALELVLTSGEAIMVRGHGLDVVVRSEAKYVEPSPSA
jgi:hypothetical protein